MGSAVSWLTPALSFPHSHFRSIDPGLKEDTLEFLIKGVYGKGVGDGRCMLLFVCCFLRFISHVMISRLW